MIGHVTFIGAGPGDPELITLKGHKALHAAQVVLHDALIEPAMLEGLPGRLINVGKRCGAHAMAQEAINMLLAREALQGQRVVRLKGGDGAVLGRLGEEMLHLTRHGVPFSVIPGVTSATAVPVHAGIPVTHRGLADGFVVATAHRRTEGEVEFSIPPYHPRTTVVLLMGLGTTALWREQLLRQGYPPELPLAFISAGSTPRQRVVRSTVQQALSDLEAANLPTPALVVVGRVVELSTTLAWFGPMAQASAEHPALPLMAAGVMG